MRQLADQAIGLGGQSDKRQRLVDPACNFRRFGTADPGPQAIAGLDLDGDPHVFM